MVPEVRSLVQVQKGGKSFCYLPRSIPMTWPFTFSSPPSVEFHLRKDAPGTLKAGERVREMTLRGSWESKKKGQFDAQPATQGFSDREELTPREIREDSIVKGLKGPIDKQRSLLPYPREGRKQGREGGKGWKREMIDVVWSERCRGREEDDEVSQNFIFSAGSSKSVEQCASGRCWPP